MEGGREGGREGERDFPREGFPTLTRRRQGSRRWAGRSLNGMITWGRSKRGLARIGKGCKGRADQSDRLERAIDVMPSETSLGHLGGENWPWKGKKVGG